MKKQCLICLLLLLPCLSLEAQYTMGTTGLLNIPTAEMQEAGTFMGGVNYMPEQLMPKRFGYNTGNYFVNMTFFSFLEINYLATLIKSTHMSQKAAYREQDRSYSIRIRPLKEGKYHPALVLGANDPLADKGINTFQSFYGVLTKGFDLARGHRVAVTLGYYIPGKKKAPYFGNQYDGAFGGISYTPAFYKQLSVMAEYDSTGFNIGAAAKLWKHLSLHLFTREFNCLSGGIRYECTLIH